MLERKDLLALATATAKADKAAPVAYSFGDKSYTYAQLNDTLYDEMKEAYYTNKELCFSILTEVLTETIPNKVAAFYGDLAEVKQFAQGQKPEFRRKVNAKTRAKQFVTRVGLAGKYEVFKLGGTESFEVPASAMGAAAQIGIEEYLDKRVDFAEMLAIISEGMEELVQLEVGQAMVAGIAQLPAANVVEVAGFDEAEFDRLLRIADSYGSGKAVIYCDQGFASKLMPANIQMFSDSMKQQIWDNGYFTVYKNHSVVILPNGVSDETNTTLAQDPSYCWIIPAGGNDKPVRISFEGDLRTREVEREDWSREIQMYRKVGVAALLTNDICVYHDTALSAEL